MRPRERARERKRECVRATATEKGATLGRALRRPQTFSENKKKEKFLRENKTLKERKEEIEGSRLENRRFFRDGFQNYVGDVRGEKGGPDLIEPKVKSLYSGGGEKRDPPHTLPSSFVTRAVPDEEEGVISNFLSKGENSGNKLELILDSGANETMVNRRSLIDTLDTRKTKIITAGKNFETGNYGTPKKVYFPNQTELQFGKENKIVFSENLTDNLVSVGRICESGLSVLFNSEKYTIFKNPVTVRGECVHTQFRDPQTGLFPLTLLTEKFSHGPDSPLYEEQKGENGNTENKTHRRRTIEEVRQNFSGLVEWAGGVCREVRNERKENKTHHTHKINEREKEFYENFYCQSLLAKFYVKPGISNYQR